MAVIRMDYFSICLMRQVTLTAIIPSDKVRLDSTEYPPEKKYKTLYMLHGVTGNSSTLLYHTEIVEYAMKHEVAVILPEGDNHYYVDCKKTGERFGEFVGKEVVELTRSMFPLSTLREDTYIGGVSMGGYGCLVNGLKYWANFGGIISMGTGVRYKHLTKDDLHEDATIMTDRPGFFEIIHGDLENVMHSDMSIEYLAKQGKENGLIFPRIYMCCGTEDFRIHENRILAELLRFSGADITMEEGPGGHTNEVWNFFMPRAFQWLSQDNSI